IHHPLGEIGSGVLILPRAMITPEVQHRPRPILRLPIVSGIPEVDTPLWDHHLIRHPILEGLIAPLDKAGNLGECGTGLILMLLLPLGTILLRENNLSIPAGPIHIESTLPTELREVIHLLKAVAPRIKSEWVGLSGIPEHPQH